MSSWRLHKVTYCLQTEGGCDVEMGEDVEGKLSGQGANNVELEGSRVGQGLQLAPLVGGQLVDKGLQGVSAACRCVQCAEGVDEGRRGGSHGSRHGHGRVRIEGVCACRRKRMNKAWRHGLAVANKRRP